MNRVWMITGAGRGLGRAFMKEAIANGDKVIATVRKMPENDDIINNANVLPVVMDITDPDAVSKGVQLGLDKFGRIDVLINNAGFGMSSAFEEMTDKELRVVMETNFFGTANVTRSVIPVMREQGGGMILSVSSQAGAMGFLGSSAYCSAKFAVVGLSEALRMELKPFNIQVSAILPGSFRTDFRDSSSMKRAENSIAAYDSTAVRDVVRFLTENNHTQSGDPAKAAKFIYSIVESGELPSRIHIGKGCCEQVKDHMQEIIDEIDGYIDTSSRTDFDE